MTKKGSGRARRVSAGGTQGLRRRRRVRNDGKRQECVLRPQRVSGIDGRGAQARTADPPDLGPARLRGGPGDGRRRDRWRAAPVPQKGRLLRVLQEAATRKGGVRRHLRSARGRKFPEAPEFGPTRYSPGTIMQSPSMCCRGTDTKASAAAGGRPAGRRTKGTRPTPPSRCGQGVAWP